MKIKTILKLFIPPVFINVYRYIKKEKKEIFTTINQIKNSNNILYVIGNGPSLSNSLMKIKPQLIKNDCIAVNQFCDTELFFEIKPKYYVIADPSSLVQLDNLTEMYKNEIIKRVDKLNEITWNMNFICPDYARTGYLVQGIEKNQNIKIFYYNTENFSKYNNILQDWDENLIAPPAQTVINTCIYLGIYLKYKEINVLGLDMSWHEDLELDQKTNQLFINDKHFYGNRKVLATLDIEGKIPAKVHEYLNCSVNALKSFWDLKSYADYKNVKIYNLSNHSWVDAFERK